MKPNARQPTKKRLAEGPNVILTSDRLRRSAWYPAGFLYPIRFDGSGRAVVPTAQFNDWIGEDLAASHGIEVSEWTPEPTKPPAEPKAKKAVKKPSVKKPSKK